MSLAHKRTKKKASTPSLGGVGLLLMLWVGCLFVEVSPVVFWVVCSYSAFACIGLYDDVAALVKGKNQGLNTVSKFLVQLVVSLGLVFWFSAVVQPLSVAMMLLAIVAFVGASNATNLTDGLDGLLGSNAIITLGGFVGIMVVNQAMELVPLVVLMVMIILGFLVFNRYPALIFMGDTGSLAMGALFVALALVLGNIWLLIPLGVVYILETLSVIIQVGYYKKTKKRIFLMSPLHHHFELIGFKEPVVVALFCLCGILGVGVVFFM